VTSHGVWKLVELQSQLRQLRQKIDVTDMGVALETAAVFAFDEDPSHGKLPKKLDDLQHALLSFGSLIESFQGKVDTDIKGITQFLNEDESQIEGIALKNAQLSDALKQSEAALTTQHADFLTIINDLRRQALPDSKPLSDMAAAVADLRSFIAKRR